MAVGVVLGYANSGVESFHKPFSGWDHQYSHRGRPDTDDVSAAGQSALRETRRSFS